MKNRIIYILVNPFVISFIISIVIILLLPPIFDKYQMKIIEQDFLHKYRIYYDDLNGDGISEEIRFMPEFGNKVGIQLFEKGKLIDQWNISGKIGSSIFFIVGDYDQNKLKEIYLLTFQNDSLFLNGFEPFLQKRLLISQKFIIKLNYIQDYLDFDVSYGNIFDLNGDNFGELILSIVSGFSRHPRCIIAYDIKNNNSLISPEAGVNISDLIVFDINNDGLYEFVLTVHATGNYNSDLPYTDQKSWLMVLNNKLEFLFNPVEIGPYPSRVQTIPYKPDNNTMLAVLFKYDGNLELPSGLFLFDREGQLLKKRELSGYSDINMSFLANNNTSERNKLFLINGNGIVEYLDSNLRTVKTKLIEGVDDGRPYQIDLDMDNTEEFIFFNNNYDKVIITRNDFSHPVIFEVNTKIFRLFSVKLKGKEKPDLFMQLNDQGYLAQYSRNPLFYLKYVIYAGIYAGIILLVLLLFRIQKYRLRIKYETEKKIAELQLRSIKNQIDPHFTLNILNAIGSLFYKKDEEKANYVFGKYSKLLRSTILKSDNILIPISEEIDYVKNYLDLEKFRLDNKFEYEITIDDEINKEMLLPKMLIHTFAENAVKHGLRHLASGGSLRISINKSGLTYLINIIDNGIGRNKARQLDVQDTHKGLVIVDNILDLYYSLYKKRITYDVMDIEEKNGGGTHVRISLPASN